METIKTSATFPKSPRIMYNAWLSSKQHSAFTGGEAKINPKIGGKISAWDNYIKGKIIELKPYKKIVQTWRSSDFSPSDKDSILEVFFENVEKGTKITLLHSNIPDGQGKGYKKGWKDYYFTPMKKYFRSSK